MALLCGAMRSVWPGAGDEHYPQRSGGSRAYRGKEGQALSSGAGAVLPGGGVWSGGNARRRGWWRCWFWRWPAIVRARASRGIGVSWTLAAAVGIFMTADVRDITNGDDLAGGGFCTAHEPAAGRCLRCAGAARAMILLTAGPPMALLGDRIVLIGLSVRYLAAAQPVALFALALLTSASCLLRR